MSDLLDRAHRVADVAKAHAADVDAKARFPREAMDAIRAEGLLGMLVPEAEGGMGLSATDVGQVTEVIARGCANTALIFAMHHIQVAGLVRHGGAASEQRRRDIAEQQLLVASATTEIGIGGDIRRSTCAVEPGSDGTFELVKNAPVISYAEYADLFAVTARRNPDAAPNDQVIVYGAKSDVELEPTGDWNTMGVRGTCSPGFILTIRSHTDAIVPEPFAPVSARTMLPCTHIFWSHVWLGMATEAVAIARAFVQRLARKTPGSPPPSALRLGELQIALSTFAATVHEAARHFDSIPPGDGELDSIAFAVKMNGLKVSSSQAVVDIVLRAMTIVGIEGYRLDREFSLGQLMRDAIGTQLMVNNDRILAVTASMELVNRGDR